MEKLNAESKSGCSRRDLLYMTSSNREMEVMGILLFKLPEKIIAVCEERYEYLVLASDFR